MTLAKSLTDVDASHSGTETNQPTKKKRKNITADNQREKASTQASMDKFMVKGSPEVWYGYGSSSAPPATWENTLKEFEELTSEEVTSLWDSKINFNLLVETNLVFEADREKIR